MSKNFAIILAAGKGKRMGYGINKQFIEIKGKPLIFYTLNVFNKCKDIDGIILVAADNEIEYCNKEIIKKYKLNKVAKVIAGGSERQESVFNGLKAVKNSDIVLIHDGARPFVTEDIIKNGIKYAKIYGACACGVRPKDTIKLRDYKGFFLSTLNRNELVSIQTPQCFDYKLIMKCHSKALKEGFITTDDTTIVERYDNKVYFYEGSYYNIKITTVDDLIISEKILEDLKK